MSLTIEELAEQRPHLKEPLQLYAKWWQFKREVDKSVPESRAAMSEKDTRAYPRDSAPLIFQAFVSIFDLPPDDFIPLCQALENGELDFMRLPLGDYLAFPTLSCSETELASLLFLLSRPYFLTLRDSFPQAGSSWENGRCPLCSAQPALASIVEGPQRRLHCSFCGTTGPYRFIGCPHCGGTDVEQLNTLLSEEEPEFRVITCDGCRSYVKVMENQVLKKMGPDLADLASLPLDIVAQEKGFLRRAPNPISLTSMA